jgi:hypothetical protein
LKPCGIQKFVKQKSRPEAATFVFVLSKYIKPELRSFHHGANAFGAQDFVGLASTDHHHDLLEVGAIGTVGRTLRETAVVAESSGLATGFTLCHFYEFLSRD